MSPARAQIGDALEHARAVELGEKLVRGGAAVLVEHGIGNVVQIVGRGVAEDQALNDRRNEQAEAAARILEDRQQLLAGQREDAEKGCSSMRLKPVSCASTARAGSQQHDRHRASTAAFGRITRQTSPARKIVCSSAT